MKYSQKTNMRAVWCLRFMLSGKTNFIESFLYRAIDELYQISPVIRLMPDKHIVIMSDFHMGDGSRNDDFAHNAPLVGAVLRDYYFPRGYTLVLNGDIEELQRFTLSHIMDYWRSMYVIFDAFAVDNRFVKIAGNHDINLLFHIDRYPYPIIQSLRLAIGAHSFFILHGHQSSLFFSYFNWFSGFTLRYLANPLGIRNFPVPQENKYRFIAEKRFYRYSRQKKIITVIGHTHRPLFESLSKADSLKMKIENLCRLYPSSTPEQRRKIAVDIRRYKKELFSVHNGTRRRDGEGALYSNGVWVPSLFNSGCAVGKSGITAIEINAKEIALVHWFDRRVSRRFLSKNGSAPYRLRGSSYYKKMIKKENIEYIFARINLLS